MMTTLFSSPNTRHFFKPTWKSFSTIWVRRRLFSPEWLRIFVTVQRERRLHARFSDLYSARLRRFRIRRANSLSPAANAARAEGRYFTFHESRAGKSRRGSQRE